MRRGGGTANSAHEGQQHHSSPGRSFADAVGRRWEPAFNHETYSTSGRVCNPTTGERSMATANARRNNHAAASARARHHSTGQAVRGAGRPSCVITVLFLGMAWRNPLYLRRSHAAPAPAHTCSHAPMTRHCCIRCPRRPDVAQPCGADGAAVLRTATGRARRQPRNLDDEPEGCLGAHHPAGQHLQRPVARHQGASRAGMG